MGARWPTWVFSNHDQPRMRTRLGGSEARARAAVLLLLTLRGTPFLYAGEELGLEDAHVPARARRRSGRARRLPRADPVDRRRPATAGPPTRGCRGRPSPAPRSVEAQRADDGSMLHLARAILALRRESPALHRGTLTLLDDAPDGVLAYERAARRGPPPRVGQLRREAGGAAGGVGRGAGDGAAGDGLPPDAAAVLRAR